MHTIYQVIRCALAVTAGSLVAAGVPAVLQAAEGDAAANQSQHQDHAAHHMTAEEIATLRKKVPLYATFSDERINASMGMMPPDTEAYLSGPAVRDSVGVLGLGHGYGGDGNDQFKAGYAGVAAVHPTAVGLGMAMMNSAHIQAAVSKLEAGGAKTIVVLPSETGEDSLVRQWKYIFGMRDEAAYLAVPRVQTKARILMAKSPTYSPIIGQLLAENLKTAIKDPTKEAALLVMHGDDDIAENADELQILSKLAAIVKQQTGISDVHYATLQDDAPPAVRAANVQAMRDWVLKAQAAGKTVLVEPVLLTVGGSVSRKIGRDLDGLTYTFVDKGMIGHPLFERWVQETVAAELKEAG